MAVTTKELAADVQRAYDEAAKRNYSVAAQYYGQVSEILDKLETGNANALAPFARGLIDRLGQATR